MTVYAGQYGPETLTDTTGRPAPTALVQIYQPGTFTPATLYGARDRSVPLTANPVPSGMAVNTPGLDIWANLLFFADPGRYDLVVTSGGKQTRLTVVVDEDPAEPEAGGGGGTAAAGPAPFKPPVPYNPATTYSPISGATPADAVSFQGSSYVAVAASTGVQPGTDTTKWALLAAGGSFYPAGQGPVLVDAVTGGSVRLGVSNGALTFTPVAGGQAPTVPGPPTAVTASAGNGTATVTATPPASNGGAAITGYTATSNPGGLTGTSATLPVTVAGLANGTAYTFTLTAGNNVGSSAASAPSNSVTPLATANVPGIPTALAVTALSRTSLSVNATAPASGGAAITGYTATATPVSTATVRGSWDTGTEGWVGRGSPPFVTWDTGTKHDGAGSLRGVKQITAADNYILMSDYPTATARNWSGGSPTFTAWVKVAAGGPAGPYTGILRFNYADGTQTQAFVDVSDNAWHQLTVTVPTAQLANIVLVDFEVDYGGSGSGNVTVNWDTFLQGAGSTGGPVSATGPALPVTVGGLVPGGLYTATVHATNSVGNGPESAASSPSTSLNIVTVPGAPTGAGAAAGDASATVSAVAPVDNGGSAILDYTATSSPGGLTATAAPGTPPTVTGLTNGTAYTFTVTARNSSGSSAPSAPSNSVTPTATATTNNFSISSSGQILDPAGAIFVPNGVNANGNDFVWQGPTGGQSGQAQAWRFNALRLNCGLPGAGGVDNGGGYDFHNNDNLSAIISEYTAKKIVIMLDMQQQNPGTYATGQRLTDIQNWWVDKANTYKNNPYVWFNLFNEPGSGGASALQQWHDVHAQVAAAIRATGAKNVIVMDGCQYGQETNDFGSGPAPTSGSAMVNYGASMQSSYGPVVFSLHVYAAWGGGSQGATNAQLDARLNGFLDAVQNANIPIMIGECGTHPNQADEQPYEIGQTPATQCLYRVLPGRTKKIGAMPWHGDGASGYQQVTNSQHWSDINSATNPTNLTWIGQDHWNYCHSF